MRSADFTANSSAATSRAVQGRVESSAGFESVSITARATGPRIALWMFSVDPRLEASA
jgi:hypothetical protein